MRIAARPSRLGCIALGAIVQIASVSSVCAGKDAPPFTIADLPKYREALAGKPGGAPVAVTFRELWDHPEAYQGKTVQIDARIVRIVAQGPLGSFPSLSEAWGATPAGDPFCLVFPTHATGTGARTGVQVRFVGTFLRLIRYEGSDGGRLAPLIVGSKAPVIVSAPPPTSAARGRAFWSADWTVGAVVAAVVVGILLTRHLRKPDADRPSPDINAPPPEFIDQKPPPRATELDDDF
jgi:hypothetical protein